MPSTSHDRIIARIPDTERRKILDAIATSSRRSTVLVEYGADRKLDGATGIVGTLQGVAYAPGATTSTHLVVRPIARKRRLYSISAAHVLRISAATVLDQPDDPEAPLYDDAMIPYRLGEVIAGPPRK